MQQLQSPPPTSDQVSEETLERIRPMKLAFEQWDREDALLTDEEADVLGMALAANRGLTFRIPTLD
jgi:hypothetical protein